MRKLALKISVFAMMAGVSLAPHIASAHQEKAQGPLITTEKLSDNVAVLFGRGGNIAVSHGADGTVLIDDQFADMTDPIKKAVADLGADEVKYLINTHWHGDHSGGNENFGNAGAIIFAHENVRIRMANDQMRGERVIAASPKAALPVITYDDGIKLHLNDDVIHVIHMPDGHTDGDSIIYWEKANIIHMGDLFFNKVTLPFIDLSSGGDVYGVLRASEMALQLANDDTKIIPGHGPMANKADLQEYSAMLVSIIAVVTQQIAEGKSLKEIQEMKPAAKWDVNPNAFIKGDAFIEAVYKSLMPK
ncbi:hypothetical protein LPB140_10105 [Sphingorhabdus lutea]|uniref:beta-lactamase n=1 Tax=Sphingorhabdus lutea TaxID=1913578 RepID=A0A1L3JF63_9SPHN|nr:MBL fold metallo-hydrolase [Sphingorhabdus lutea]APG63781.1 hypothetical protein LPB140_10105 [Sphingorhabdus lutea]